MKNTFLVHNPRCRKSREALNYLKELNVDFEIVLYMKEGLEPNLLESIINRVGINPKDMIRTQEKIWKENYKSKKLSNDEIIFILHEHPNLIKRPIVIKNNKAIIAIPPSEIIKILN